MWGSQTYSIDPDCLVAAKGLSSAYQPISALLMKPDFYQGLERGNEATGNFAHGGTYHAHPVAAAVALETLRIFERRRIIEHVRAMLPVWQAILGRLSTHPLVRETRHAGLLGALELGLPGAERRSGVATSLSIGGLPRQVYEAGLECGIITRPLAGCIVLAPPLIISEAELEELESRLREALDKVLSQQPATDLHSA
jgi:4-aminobutyrate--pyruvate transaminase